MNYNRHVKNDSAWTVKVVCAVVFMLFSFLWLFFFQADVLYVAQHVLSGGQTRYDPLVGALLIIVVLWMVQLGVYSMTRLSKRSHALTWFPSFLLLAMLTSFGSDLHFPFGMWWWLLPLLLIFWGCCLWVALKIQPYESAPSGIFSRRVWFNLMLMTLMICGVAVCSNTDAVFHYRAHAEYALLQGKYDKALETGNRSLETDGNLMMLRMYGLSRMGQLAERLFEYPIVPTSDVMLPTTTVTRFMVYPSDSLYRHLGAIPRREMKPMDYLQTIIRSGQAKSAAIDYLLCGYLIDRDLDGFARKVGHYYTINDSLPRYYREALVLYTHRRSHPVVVYHDAVLDVDYDDLQKMEAECGSDSERRGKALENYADSYWYYFDYASRQ